MSTLVSLRIESWGNKFVVVGEFMGYSEIPRRELNTYPEALKELSKLAHREIVRWERQGK